MDALDSPNIKGTDGGVSPLTEAVLDAMVADLKLMTTYIQRNFTIHESGKPLSERDAGNLATKAVVHLRSGASSATATGTSWSRWPCALCFAALLLTVVCMLTVQPFMAGGIPLTPLNGL